MNATMNREAKTMREVKIYCSAPEETPNSSATEATKGKRSPPASPEEGGARRVPRMRIMVGPIPHAICEIAIFLPRFPVSEFSEI